MTRSPRSQSGRPIKGDLLRTTPYLLQTSSRMYRVLSTMLMHKSSICRSQDSSSRAFVPDVYSLVPTVNTTSSVCGKCIQFRSNIARMGSLHRKHCAAHGIPPGRNFGNISVQRILASRKPTMDSFTPLTAVPISAAGRVVFGVSLSTNRTRLVCTSGSISQNQRRQLPMLS